MITVSPEVEKAAGKRDKILRAGVEVFARNGYFNSKVSEIARAAGVADGTIYLYFSSKEEILITIFREQMREFLERLDAALDPVTDASDRLKKIVEIHLGSSGANRDLAIVFQVELRHSLKFMSLFSHQELAEYLQRLRAVVELGQQQGSFRGGVHPQLAAKAIFGVLDEMVTSWILSEKLSRLEQSSSEVADLLLGGLRAD